MLTTEGHLLGGRLRYAQPADGYRTGIEPVLLAAAVPARPGDRVLEAGTGAGAALLCLAARVSGIEAVGVEIDRDMAELARRNIHANALSGLVVEVGDILAAAPRGLFHHAMANPPWHAATSTPSPVPRRLVAKRQSGAGLDGWIGALAAALHPGGSLTLIVPAALSTPAIAAMARHGVGGVVHTPLWPKAGRPAKLALLTGHAGGGPGLTDSGVVLHDADGRFSAAADAVLRCGAALTRPRDAGCATGVHGPPQGSRWCGGGSPR